MAGSEKRPATGSQCLYNPTAPNTTDDSVMMPICAGFCKQWSPGGACVLCVHAWGCQQSVGAVREEWADDAGS
eukprot:1707989-Rhodomonas_salina.2